MQTEQVIEFSIRNSLAEIATASTTLDNLGDRLSIPAKALMQLQVALDEVLSNVIKYAWPEGGEHTALVQVRVGSDRMQIKIIDDGKPFDLCQYTRTKPAAAGKKHAYGGRGISMVKQLVDGIEYARVDNRNHLTISKSLARS